MKALTWHGKGDMRCEEVPDPRIEDGRDAIVKVTACAICGSDLHIYDGVIPSMEHGDIVGHESMGEVVEVPSPSPAANASSAAAASIRAASDPIRTRTRLRKSGGVHPPAFSVIRICSADIRAARPNMCVFRSPMSVQ